MGAGKSVLTTEMLSLDTRQNVMCLPVSIVCSTRRVNNGSDHGNWFKWARNERSWKATGSDMMSLSANRANKQRKWYKVNNNWVERRDNKGWHSRFIGEREKTPKPFPANIFRNCKWLQRDERQNLNWSKNKKTRVVIRVASCDFRVSNWTRETFYQPKLERKMHKRFSIFTTRFCALSFPVFFFSFRFQFSCRSCSNSISCIFSDSPLRRFFFPNRPNEFMKVERRCIIGAYICLRQLRHALIDIRMADDLWFECVYIFISSFRSAKRQLFQQLVREGESGCSFLSRCSLERSACVLIVHLLKIDSRCSTSSSSMIGFWLE